MSSIKKYSILDYMKGNPELNLLRAQRRLIIKALLRSDWAVDKAYKLNYPNENICLTTYRKSIYKHHISLRKKKYKKIEDIP